MKPNLANALTSTAAAIDATDAAGAPVKRVQLIPIGAIDCRDGRKYRIADAAAAQSVIELTRRYLGRTDLLLDYDHHSENAKTTGTRSTAAGWAKTDSLSIEDDGIYADIEWNAAASAALAAREYRYISPTFFHDAGGNVLALKSGALTNTPAIDRLAAVASTQEMTMDLTAIAKALGLAETATIEEIVAAIEANKTGAEPALATASALSAAATGLGLAATASVTDVLAAASTAAAAAAVDPAQFVPIAGVLALQNELAAIRAGHNVKSATAAVDEATEEGKVTPALRDWAIKLATKDRPAFDKFVASASVVLTPGEDDKPGGKTDASGLTADQLATCSNMGLTPAEFLAAQKED